MSDTITKLKEEYDKKVKEIQDLMKNPNRDAGLFHVDIGFKDKGAQFAGQGGTITSSVDRLQNHSVIGYPYKRGVKLSYEADDNDEPCVEAGGGADLYGICIDIDEFTGTATVLPITNNFTGYLVVKKDSKTHITPDVKVKFDANGEIDKDTGSGSRIINGIALSKAFQINENLHLDPDIYHSMDDTEIVEFLKQQLVQAQEEQLQQITTHTSGGGRRHAPVIETEEGKTLKDYILKLKKYSKSFNYDEKSVL